MKLLVSTRVAAPVFLALGLAVAVGCARRAEPAPPNLLLVSLDTVRADHLGIYGFPGGTSPHFDRFARGGVLFAECMAQATATLPSHRSMFRSRPASRARAETPLIAEVLRDAGWATVAFTGGGNIAGSLGFEAGFDGWSEDRGGLAWSNPEFARWLDADRRGPFFALVHTYDAHMPYDPPRALAEYFDPGYSGIVTGETTRPLARALRGLDPLPEGPPSLSVADRRRFVALYDGAIRHTDDLFGELLRILEVRGLLESTSIAVVSDHGEEFWDHGSVLHSHTVHRELAHVPFAIAGTGASGVLQHGVVRGEIVRLLDVAPTLLDLAGLPPAPSFDGESLLPAETESAGAAAAPPTRADRPALIEMAGDKALLEYPWKLIVSNGGATRRLYHVAGDPGEMRDLAAGGAPHGAGGVPAAQADSIVAALSTKLAGMANAEAVDELSREAMTPEQRDRLKALGYVN